MNILKCKTALFLLSAILTLPALPIQAEILNVPDDFETIQGAINESEDGDTVLVQPETYVENIDFEGKDIIVASLYLIEQDEDHIDNTIIDGDENGDVVTFRNEESEDAVLIGFTVRNGSRRLGGGIYCGNHSNPTLISLKVIENTAGLDGGGIVIYHSDPTLINVIVSENSAGYWGGGIYMRDSNPLIISTVIYSNSAESRGGGIFLESDSSPTLSNVTIYGNHSEETGGGIVSWMDSNPTLNNCIVWENTPSTFVGEDLTVTYSDVQDGFEGEGNIDEDPLFVDPDEGNFHLTEDSPCIDTGDPDSPDDPDGTRADMGAFPFSHGTLVIEGFVLDAENNEPLDSARVSSSFGYTTFTDTSGFWRISPPRINPFNITASFEDYLDSTIRDIQLELDDTLEITFGLLHPEFQLSEEEIEVTIEAGDSTEIELTISNRGNGALSWQAKKQLAGEAGADPWELRTSINATEVTGDTRLQGVVFVEDRFYLSGANIAGRSDSANMIWVLNHDGVLVDSFAQLGRGTYGMRDLAWDGELIWGSGESRVYGFTTEGDSITSFEGPFSINSALAWDLHREVLWVARKTGNTIHAYNHEGQEIDSLTLDQMDIRIYGLAYWQDDPDGYNLYILNRSDNSTQMVHKMNPVTGDTMLVSILNPEGGGSPGGCFISNQYDPRSWVFMNIANDANGDRIDIWQVEGNTSWMILNPEMGEVESESSQDLNLSIFTEGLTVDYWEAELVFNHNAAGGETILPVTLTIEPAAVDSDEKIIPDEFGITGIYPNPFNSVVRIEYSLDRSATVSMKVFDLSGRMVTNICDHHQNSGEHQITFDSSSLPSGIYLLRIMANNQADVAKVICIK